MAEKKVKRQMQTEHLTVADDGLDYTSFITGKSEDFQFGGTWAYAKLDLTWHDGLTKTYSTAAITEDVTELMIIAHRTEGKVDEILSALEDMKKKDEDPESETTECLEITDEEAAKIITTYMREHDRAWPQDISTELHLDFGQVMRVTRKMLDEGVLEDIDKEEG